MEAYLQQEVYGFAVRVVLFPVVFGLQSEYVFDEKAEDILQFLQVVGGDGSFAVGARVDELCCIEEVRYDYRGVKVVAHGLLAA